MTMCVSLNRWGCPMPSCTQCILHTSVCLSVEFYLHSEVRSKARTPAPAAVRFALMARARSTNSRLMLRLCCSRPMASGRAACTRVCACVGSYVCVRVYLARRSQHLRVWVCTHEHRSHHTTRAQTSKPYHTSTDEHAYLGTQPHDKR